ncbi:MAG: hypothetical protein ACYSUT_08860 [Planctomycetota bacterium]
MLASFVLQTMALIATMVVIIIIGLLTLLVKCYRKPSQGQAIIRNGFNSTCVSFEGMITIPIIHEVEWLDITLKRLVIDQQGNGALECKDGTRVEIKSAFFVRVNPTQEDVLKVVQALGVEGAADVEKLADLFNARFLESLQTVAKDNTIEQLSDREYFKREIMSTIDTDLDGYLLDTVTIDYLEKTKTA